MFATFKELFELDDKKPTLTYEQVLRLKQASACHKIVPSVIMTPVAFSCLKLAVQRQTNMSSVKIIKHLLIWLCSYQAAILARDLTYWPIVL